MKRGMDIGENANFTTWVKAKAFHQVRDTEVRNFVWKNIICRFDVPHKIITDNGSQFISHEFQDFCTEWNIRLQFAIPRDPDER